MKKEKLVKENIKKEKAKKIKVSKPKEVKNKKNIKGTILAIILALGIIGITAVLVFALYIIITAPEFNRDRLYSKEPTIIYYSDGSEMTRYGADNRVLVTYDDLPQVLVDAIVATEDSRFFQHTGLDVARFAKALLGQLIGNDKAGGASTLSMQVIKQDYTSKESHGIKGIIRKFTDIYMSIFKLESNYTKEEIMEFYVNTMWFSGDTSIYIEKGISGVEQASQYFFGKSVSNLSLAEASILAGMFQNPINLNPYTKEQAVTDRQNIVLTLMVQHGYITEQEKTDVQKIPISSLLVDHSNDSSKANKATIDYIISQVSKATGKNPYTTPMKIYTTVNKDVQNVLNQLETGEIYEFPNEFLQEGIAITSTENGSIVALSGGRTYNNGAKGNNNATDIRRQPGSTAKILFDYGPYLEAISGSSPYSLFLDRETTYSNGTPIKNADGKHSGLVSMRYALVNSINIPALIAFQTVAKEKGLDYISNFVHSLGIDYGSTLYESAAIGGFDGVSPLQMSAAYAAYGRGGYYIEPYIYTKIEYTDTGEIYEYKYEKKQVMSEETAYLITDMLMSAAKSGVGGVSISGTDIAAKSGTTTMSSTDLDYYHLPASATNDAWNITYSPEYSIALWLGYSEKSSEHYLNSIDGGKWRNAIMKQVGQRVYSKGKTFEKPDGVISVTVENETFPAQLASPYTPNDLKVTELFKEGTEPTEVSPRYNKLDDATNGSYTYNGTTLTLKWDKINTPWAINTTMLTDHFNTYYGNYASEYYNLRLDYNNKYIGTLEYRIYAKETDGTLTYIGSTANNTYTINSPRRNVTTYVIKSSYTKFTSNMSDGLSIKVNLNVDSNVHDFLDDDPTTNKNDTSTNNSTHSNDLE